MDALRSTGIYPCRISDLEMFARSFNLAAVAAVAAAPGGNGAVKVRLFIAPDNDLAAISVGTGIGHDGCVFFHLRGLGVAFRALTKGVAAHQGRTAALVAGNVDLCLAGQGHILAGHHDLAALLPTGSSDETGRTHITVRVHAHATTISHSGRSVHSARIDDIDTGTRPLEDDFAALQLGGCGGDLPAVHHGADNPVQLRGGQHYHTAFGLDGTTILHTGQRRTIHGVQGIHVLFIYGEGDQIIAVHVQLPGAVPGSEGDFRELARDYAVIAHSRGHQGRQTVFFDTDSTLVDDLGIWAARLVEDHIALHEIVIADVPRCGCKAVGVDAGPLVDDHARRIDQVDIAVGLQLPHDLAGAAPTHDTMQARRVG